MKQVIVIMSFLLLLSGCGGSGGDSDDSIIPGECSAGKSVIEQEMTTVLAGLDTDTDFAFHLEDDQGDSFDYHRDSINLDTSLESASTSKWITAVIILRLVDQGFLTLEDTPQDHISSWPIPVGDSLRSITLANLLNFTSGLVESPGCLNWGISNFDNCVEKIATDNIGNGKIPGEEFYYSGTHLQVAGQMAINAGGFSDWQAVVADFKASTGLFASSQYDLPSTSNPSLPTYKKNYLPVPFISYKLMKS